mmetsp:Transcript_97839/g.226872  ORF Transcript_97839/g.226872 Transcript_97839/m.226872 type:complete len:213 (+) Transcript_97839:369-1007(+)
MVWPSFSVTSTTVNRLPTECTSIAKKAPTERRKDASMTSLPVSARQPVASELADCHGWQGTQAEVPISSAKVPSSHCSHRLPRWEKRPVGHSVHGSSPAWSCCLPAGHSSQRCELINCWPTGQRIFTSPESLRKSCSLSHAATPPPGHQHKRCWPAFAWSPKSNRKPELLAAKPSSPSAFTSPQARLRRIRSPSRTPKPMFAAEKCSPRTCM